MKNYIKINSVVYGYRDIFTFKIDSSINNKENQKNKILNDDYPCGYNVVCPEGDDWCLEKRAVAKVFIPGEGGYDELCSGTLLNYAGINNIPYFLTAFHCLDRDSKDWFLAIWEKNAVQNWRFKFKWYRETCSENSNDDLYDYSVDGAEFKSANKIPDFALLQLIDNNGELQNHDVYYAGWTKSTSAPCSSACIHYPYYNPMKINLDYDCAESSDCPRRCSDGVDCDENYWYINSFEKGGINLGSSGSALFNQDHYIQGICTHLDGQCWAGMDENWFGKFSVAYGYDGDGKANDEKLKPWLDPDNTGIESLYGLFTPEVHIYGRIHDPKDLDSEPSVPDEHIKYYNPGVLRVGSGCVVDNIRPFKVKYYPDEDYPGKVSLISKKEIDMKPCTQILYGAEFHAYISCSNEPISESTENDYNNLCSGNCGIQPKIIKIQDIQSSKQVFISRLYQNIPNPYSNFTDIRYSIGIANSVSLIISNIFGIKVAELVSNPRHPAGEYKVSFDASNVPSGIYFYTLRTPDFVDTKQMVIIK